jgi:hypothetical protein
MILTLQLSLVLIVSLCILIYAAVGLIQNRKLFTTAPKDIQEAAKEHPERFRGAHVLGWKLAVISVSAMIGAFVWGGCDGIRNGFTFRDHFVRYLLMLYILKAFDIICLDWFLLTKTHFFQYFCPETEGCAGYHQFGFNRKEQLFRIIIFPFISAMMAWITMYIGGTL